MQRPLYELLVDAEGEEAVVDAIALVGLPAIESNFLQFSDAKTRYNFSDEKMELLGAAMIPNMRIYRFDPQMGEYDVFFSAEQVKLISRLYSKKGFQNNFNLEHSATPAKSYMFESYILDSRLGKHSPDGLDLPDGTWMIGVKVEDPAVWADIKSGKLQGFSIEGIFKMMQVKFNLQANTTINKETAQIADIYNSIAGKLKNYN